MNARMGSGWQFVLTDLSMILFLITAAAVADAPPSPPPRLPAAPRSSPVAAAVPALGEPVAVWQAGAHSQSLAQWLNAQPADPRIGLTIIAPVGDAAAAQALARAAGRPARIVLEPYGQGPPFAALTYDRAGMLARPLQTRSGQNQAGSRRIEESSR